MVLKALLVLLVLLLVLSLDDLLGLLGDSVELNVEGTLLVVLDGEEQSLDLVLDLSKLCVVLQDLLHIVYLGVTLVLDAVVLGVDDADIDKDGILVVSGNWKLRHFDLSLLQVDDHLEVKLELLLAVD